MPRPSGSVESGNERADGAQDEVPAVSQATVRVQLLREGARLPVRATENATGFDLFACTGGETIRLGQRPTLVPTGIAIEVPPGFDAQVRPRSGLAKSGVLCTYGTIDADYRGELLVALYTLAPEIEHEVHDGDRIAQLVISRLADIRIEGAKALSTTARGSGGHGSTGR